MSTKNSYDFLVDTNEYIYQRDKFGQLQECKADCKREGYFFFYVLSPCYMNEITELRYRIDRNETVIEYDRIDALCPIKMTKGKGFVTIRIHYKENRTEFCKSTSYLIKSIDNEDVFGAEAGCTEYDVAIVSAIPNLRFTSLSCTQRHNKGNDYPLINVGRKDEDFNMPIALSVHHGFVDGEHIADFYWRVQNNLDS